MLNRLNKMVDCILEGKYEKIDPPKYEDVLEFVKNEEFDITKYSKEKILENIELLINKNLSLSQREFDNAKNFSLNTDYYNKKQNLYWAVENVCLALMSKRIHEWIKINVNKPKKPSSYVI